MSTSDEKAIEGLISRYQKKIFALALYMVGGGRDKAYDIATSSFAKVLRRNPSLDDEYVFLINVATIVVSKCRALDVIPVFDQYDFTSLPSEKRRSLEIINRALQALPTDMKAILLLRDQLHLSYSDIAPMLKIPENSARIQTVQARAQLREKIQEVLSGTR
ncbi:MAG: sigma factor-like helix-turn-helix DNA-binding protein [Candidatus Omnitrophota bacterium]